MGEKKMEPMVDIKELSKILGVSESFIREAKRSKGLPCYNLGKLKFRTSEVEKWLKERKEK